MRITVADVLSSLASGMSEEEILSDFPELTRDDIRACLAYAAELERQTLVSRCLIFYSISTFHTNSRLALRISFPRLRTFAFFTLKALCESAWFRHRHEG